MGCKKAQIKNQTLFKTQSLTYFSQYPKRINERIIVKGVHTIGLEANKIPPGTKDLLSNPLILFQQRKEK